MKIILILYLYMIITLNLYLVKNAVFFNIVISTYIKKDVTLSVVVTVVLTVGQD